MGQGNAVAAPYNMVALAIAVAEENTVLMVQEARLDCRGTYYVPAGRSRAGEDPLQTAVRVTRQKTGLDVEATGVLGIEHSLPVGQFPGQLRVIVQVHVLGGQLRSKPDEHALDAMWVQLGDLKRLRLRSDDFMPWVRDKAAGMLQELPVSSWRAVGKLK